METITMPFLAVPNMGCIRIPRINNYLNKLSLSYHKLEISDKWTIEGWSYYFQSHMKHLLNNDTKEDMEQI